VVHTRIHSSEILASTYQSTRYQNPQEPYPLIFLLTKVSRSAIGESVFRLSVVPPDVHGFPKLVTLSEREKEGFF
jgi:hypothetical protein